MSTKAFYQTLYQTEHLFRMPGETLADWGVSTPAPTEAKVPPAVPKVPPVREPEVPVVVEEVVEATLVKPAEPVVEAPLALPKVTEPVSPLPAEEPVLTDTRPPARTIESQKPALLKHKVLLLADEDLSPSDLLFLEKILKAVNLDINGVDLLNVYGVKDVDFAQVLHHKYINHFITFGVPFSRINLDILMDRYHPIRFDGITFLMVDSLPVIEASQPLKRKLWESLKRVFEL